MIPKHFFDTIVEPTLKLLQIPVTKEAQVLVMTIAGQESNWSARRQIGGPARSFWQFERMGGVAEVFQKTPSQLEVVCDALDIPFIPDTVFEAMAWNDTLACSMARFLLWQDPHTLPAIGDYDASWDYYNRNWRPGAPHRDVWNDKYDKAVKCL